MTDISHLKAKARQSAFAVRKTVHGCGLDKAANQNLLELLTRYSHATIFSGYMPIRTEVNPLPTMHTLHQLGKVVCVPVVTGKARPLAFRVWTPESKLIDGKFGAAVPESGVLVAPDVLITPLLAFDRECFRLGYGGGFYDRSFEELRRNKPVKGIGFAYGAQEISQVPRDGHDYRLDYVVSEQGVISA